MEHVWCAARAALLTAVPHRYAAAPLRNGTPRLSGGSPLPGLDPALAPLGSSRTPRQTPAETVAALKANMAAGVMPPESDHGWGGAGRAGLRVYDGGVPDGTAPWRLTG